MSARLGEADLADYFRSPVDEVADDPEIQEWVRYVARAASATDADASDRLRATDAQLRLLLRERLPGVYLQGVIGDLGELATGTELPTTEEVDVALTQTEASRNFRIAQWQRRTAEQETRRRGVHPEWAQACRRRLRTLRATEARMAAAIHGTPMCGSTSGRSRPRGAGRPRGRRSTCSRRSARSSSRDSEGEPHPPGYRRRILHIGIVAEGRR